MINRNFVCFCMFLSLLVPFASAFGNSASEKRALEWGDVIDWRRITESKISDDGKHIAVVTNPWRGDAILTLHDKNEGVIAQFDCAKQVDFLDNRYLSFVRTEPLSVLDSLERAKSKAKRPNSILTVYDIKNKTVEVLDTVVSFNLAKEQSVIAYKKKEGKTESLIVRSLKSQLRCDNVKDYAVSTESASLVYSTDSVPYRIFRVNLETLEEKELYTSELPIKRVSISQHEHGNIAFITGEKKDLRGTSNRLFTVDKNGLSEVALAANTPKDWIFNEHGPLYSSKSGARLVFSTSPQYLVDDTLTLASRKAKLDVWHWSEPVLHTEQLVSRDKDRKRSYQALYFVSEKRSQQIATVEMPSVVFPNEADADYAYSNNSTPYMIERMWVGDTRTDLYVIDVANSSKTRVFEGLYAKAKASPMGKHLYWYHASDSSWRSYNIAEKKSILLASPKNFVTYDHLNDTPRHPSAQSDLLWNDTETAVLAQGRYDLWQLNPISELEPVNVTKIGGIDRLKLKPILLEKDQKTYDDKDPLLLSTFDEVGKGSGLASIDLRKGKITILHSEPMKYGTLKKAQDADVVLLTKESFSHAPDIYLATLDKKPMVKITNISPQQTQFNWGSVEQISWVSFRGDTLNGLLYKPENFDETKKYPLICNFYERSSDGRYSYKTPEPHRSTIDYHYYTSNGYVIFNPDIKYYTGEPGASCYDALMPGIDKVLEMGFVDEKRIAAQGHSWGGYQVAHLATVTDRFAAIESGAPLVNMVSAYGGIRWETGLNRAFQYEKTQSRIGASLWEAKEEYIANSPIFNMDKVTTPILIMHNDKDGHVPWWLGIEYFIALRRLQKPAWMLNYNGEPHWPMKMPNRIDFQMRMAEFFDHYLKGKPMPEWMETGVPAVEKGL